MGTIKKGSIHQSKAWYGNKFAIIPVQALLDSRLGPRHLKVLLFLAHHASRDRGECYPSQDGLAEACGWYIKDKKSGEIRPDDGLVSRLISNPNHDKPKKNGQAKKDTGPGLVELGYVENLGQRGYSKTNLYRLSIPKYRDGDLRVVTDRKLSNVEYAAKRASEQKQEFAEQEVVANAQAEAQEREIEAARIARGAFIWRGTEYTRMEVDDAYGLGDWGDLPQKVVEHYGYSWSFIDGEF